MQKSDGPTPTIPEWIKSFRTPSYTNIYELIPKETRLYGTESLYGDWSGELLLLAKDFAPRTIINERLQDGDLRPYRHSPKAPTNKNIIEYTSPFQCGILYGAALVGLLRNDGNMSGALPDRKQVWPFACESLRFVVDQMPNLRAIACLGSDAWRCVTDAYGVTGADWREHREQQRPVHINKIQMFAHVHPSRYPGGKVKISAQWRSMGESLGFC